MTRKKLTYTIAAILLLIIGLLIAFNRGGAVFASAASAYSNVLDDLRKDPKFDPDKFTEKHCYQYQKNISATIAERLEHSRATAPLVPQVGQYLSNIQNAIAQTVRRATAAAKPPTRTASRHSFPKVGSSWKL